MRARCAKAVSPSLPSHPRGQHHGGAAADASSVAVALLHDTVEDVEEVTLEVIQKEFGEEIKQLVDGVTKLGKLDFQDREEQQAESWRKMIPPCPRTSVGDHDRWLTGCTTCALLSYQAPDCQVAIALETLDIYAPLAHRLGVYSIKSEIEDLALRYIDPQGYRDVATKVGQKRIEREAQITTIIETLREKLVEMGLQGFDIDGRPKHLYSIYRKMVIQNRTFDQIYDLIAIRVIVDTIPECYTALGAAHALWTQMPGHSGTISPHTPKANMCSPSAPPIGGRTSPFEVQIGPGHAEVARNTALPPTGTTKEGRRTAACGCTGSGNGSG